MVRWGDYPPMAVDEQRLIDDRMKAEYGATRSVVTNGEWIDGGRGAWVCAYARIPEVVHEMPELYMVHFAVDSQVTIVYKSVKKV